jgi:deoxycytidine triphosphate deaminase
MLNSDDIAEIIEELNFETGNPTFPFSAENQLRPISIDLRLSEKFWKPRRKFRPVDIVNSKNHFGININGAFKEGRINLNKGYVLRPNEFILARTYEKFSIPNNLAGLLRGRSSLGRLGLSVVSASSTINPGWSGHMPLMLINHAPFSIKIYPYMGIVQLLLLRLNKEVTRSYSDQFLGAKYLDDDGGPSRYWLDVTVHEISEYLKGSPKIQSAQMKFAANFSRELDEHTRKRFSQYISGQISSESSEQLIQGFINSERIRSFITNSLPISWPLIIAASYGVPRLYGLSTFWSSITILAGVLISLILIAIWFRRNWATPKSVTDLQGLQKLINK